MRMDDDPMDRQRYMSEVALAQRVLTERKKRGWSQEKLAEKVEALLGGGFPQSAVSKIEREMGQRRAVTVEEALALSSVFEIPLDELLLPEGFSVDQRVLRLLRAAHEADGAIAEAMRAKRRLMEEVLVEVERDPELMGKLTRLVAVGGAAGQLARDFLEDIGLEVEVEVEVEVAGGESDV